MIEKTDPGRPSRSASFGQFALGFALAVALLGGLAEAYLRHFPPRDFDTYRGEASPLTGLLAPDADFGVTYRSWEVFRDDYAARLRELGPLHASADDRKTWAFFGNSFVQAPGMLADTARQQVTQRRIFNLGRNELLIVRLAQIKLLLEHGFEPERIFIELMPLDTAPLARQQLATVYVTSRGALTYRPRLPAGPAGWLVRHSELVEAAWFSAGRHQGNPHFHYLQLHQGMEPPLLEDLSRLFGNLARITQQRHVPVTVILIPTYEQIAKDARFGFQDTLGPRLRELGYDVFDPRDVFRNYPDPPALFIPDRHFSPLGNDLLLNELLRHIQAPPFLAQARQGEPIP